MKKHILMGLVSSLLAVPALAQSKTAPAPATKPGAETLSCSSGTRQIGGAKSFMEASGCVKFSRDGSRIFHGPYVAYWKNGIKQAEGQYDEGFRSGTWTFFNEQGVKDGQTSFKMGDYDGLRVEFHANGQKKLEETYVMGRRQGAQKMFDQAGRVLSQLEFVDDRPVSTR